MLDFYAPCRLQMPKLEKEGQREAAHFCIVALYPVQGCDWWQRILERARLKVRSASEPRGVGRSLASCTTWTHGAAYLNTNVDGNARMAQENW